MRLAAALALAALLAGGLQSQAPQAAERVAVSQPLPAEVIAVQSLDGSMIDLSARLRTPQEGRAALVVFWGTWCAPCIREIPELKELQRFYGKRGLEVIGVGLKSGEETLSGLANAAEAHGITYPIYFDARGEAARVFGVTALPAAALIDGAGVVRWMGPSLPKDINERIQAALRPGEDSAGR
ncbi:MAG: TlpA family protein disulfide reductase [Candidatus Polarisedimenticolia bacterium]